MMTQAIPKVFDMEKNSYPSDEAASLEAIEYRASVTEGLCQIARHASTNEIIGFVTATAAPEGTERMTESMMKEHCAAGNVAMLDAYVNNIRSMGKYDRILLISKRYLVHFYESVGFSVVGESAISHGKDTWIEMELSLRRQ
ncbi:hypothetical protein FGB62_142g051 [Gracilaria domingensis]|nr:hypothetical protein FGB62_142g051 [Gracilaria domingensis]